MISPDNATFYQVDSGILYDLALQDFGTASTANTLWLSGNLTVYGVDANYVNSLAPGSYQVINSDPQSGYYNVALLNNAIYVEVLGGGKIGVYLSGPYGPREDYTYLHTFQEGY